MHSPLAIIWFRQDLRITDNPALVTAARHGRVLPVYILDDESAGEWQLGAASRWWLHHSLQELDRSLGGKLWVLKGNASELLPQLAQDQGATLVTWNRCYEPWRIARDTQLKSTLREAGVDVQSSNGSFLIEPGTLVKVDGSPYKVFTPFYKQALWRGFDTAASITTEAIQFIDCPQLPSRFADLKLLPSINWYAGLQQCWQPGVAGADKTLQRFLDNGLPNYRKGRDFPALQNVSRLSPHLHFGEISPRQILAAVQQHAWIAGYETEAEHFLRELIWREFSYSLLWFFPSLTNTNLKSRFDQFPWQFDPALLRAWQQGQTGYPMVDAGMRELWQTGYMHNRVRMIVASFLIKNLMLHWTHGARWFHDCLVDADLANNSCSWQWVAGSGMDAAPYFRIFNPVTQSLKFDAQGDYIRQFVPELSMLPPKYLHDPGNAPPSELARAGITLGETYPYPVVELGETRKRALAAYKALSK